MCVCICVCTYVCVRTFAYATYRYAFTHPHTHAHAYTHTHDTCARCCSVLERIAICCSMCTHDTRARALLCCVLQCAAVCCSVLQCVAVCCSALQCVAVCCRVLQCRTMQTRTQIPCLPDANMHTSTLPTLLPLLKKRRASSVWSNPNSLPTTGAVQRTVTRARASAREDKENKGETERERKGGREGQSQREDVQTCKCDLCFFLSLSRVWRVGQSTYKRVCMPRAGWLMHSQRQRQR